MSWLSFTLLFIGLVIIPTIIIHRMEREDRSHDPYDDDPLL